MPSSRSDEEDSENIQMSSGFERADEEDDYHAYTSSSENEETNSGSYDAEEMDYEQLISSIFLDEGKHSLEEKGVKVLGKPIKRLNETSDSLRLHRAPVDQLKILQRGCPKVSKAATKGGFVGDKHVGGDRHGGGGFVNNGDGGQGVEEEDKGINGDEDYKIGEEDMHISRSGMGAATNSKAPTKIQVS